MANMIIDKLIFLDIDGVLNNSAMGQPDLYRKINDIDTTHGRLSSTNIKNLNILTDNTKAKIVISSTWRILSDLAELRDILYNAGVTGEIVGVTPELDGYCLRGNEICVYMTNKYSWDEQEQLRYVILDDDSDMLYWQRNNFFWCDPFCGLSPGIVHKASRFLNGII